MQLGFQEVRKASLEDLLPARNAWIEVRALPIFSWKETNFKNLLEEFGQVRYCCRMVDDDNTYQNPTFLVETFHSENIRAVKKIRIMNKIWRVHLMELGRQVGAMYDLNRESWDIGNTTEQSPHSVQDQLTGQLPVNPTQGEYENSVPNSEGQGEVHDEGDLEESSDSLINPLTPRLYTFHEDLIASIQDTDLAPTQIPVKEDTMDVVTSHWIPREKESSSSKQQFTSDELSAIEDCSMVSMENEVPDHIDVMEAMQNLKVKTKRGRPRKSVSTKINKFFKLPRRKKSKAKGVGLKQISHYCLNNNLSEEESVFETGVLMGLIPIDTKQKSLEKISAQLKV